eukprot:25175-Pelagomonas_calceolata.AAC.1
MTMCVLRSSTQDTVAGAAVASSLLVQGHVHAHHLRRPNAVRAEIMGDTQHCLRCMLSVAMLASIALCMLKRDTRHCLRCMLSAAFLA